MSFSISRDLRATTLAIPPIGGAWPYSSAGTLQVGLAAPAANLQSLNVTGPLSFAGSLVVLGGLVLNGDLTVNATDIALNATATIALTAGTGLTATATTGNATVAASAGNVLLNPVGAGNSVQVGGTGSVVTAGSIQNGSGAVSARTIVVAAQAAGFTAIVNTLYHLPANTATNAIAIPAASAANIGSTIAFKLVGANGNNFDWNIADASGTNLAAGSTLTSMSQAGVGPVGQVAGAVSGLSIRGDTGGGGGMGSTAVFESDGAAWLCTANLVNQGNGAAVDDSQFV